MSDFAEGRSSYVEVTTGSAVSPSGIANALSAANQRIAELTAQFSSEQYMEAINIACDTDAWSKGGTISELARDKIQALCKAFYGLARDRENLRERASVYTSRAEQAEKELERETYEWYEANARLAAHESKHINELSTRIDTLEDSLRLAREQPCLCLVDTDGENQCFVCQQHCHALRLELMKAREQIQKLDPYGIGVTEKGTEF